MFTTIFSCSSVRSILPVAAILFLSACGGGGGDGNSSTALIEESAESDTVEGRNFSLSREGAVATSTFSGNESFVIDGVLDKNSFWSPGADGDSITVELEELSIVKNITINFTRENFGSSDFVVDVSEDGSNFSELTRSDCLIVRFSTSSYSCELLELPVRFLRLTIPDITTGFNINEIQMRDEFASRNVALSTEGGAIVSSNISGADRFVIDGIVDDGNAWLPTVVGDFLTIELDKSYEIYTIYIDYISSDTAPFELSISEDGLNFSVQDFFSDCSSLRVSNTSLSCGLRRVDGGRVILGREIRYVRLTVLSSIDDLEVNEIRLHKKSKIFCPLNFSSCPDIQIVD